MNIFEQARQGARQLNLLSEDRINAVLLHLADATMEAQGEILEANARDLALKDPADPNYDRLKLTPERIAEIADALRSVAALLSPLGRTLAQWTRPNGMTITKVSVPFGVIGIIYEARPNVTFDVFSLCLKAGSAVVMKGGRDAQESNRAIVALIHRVLEQEGLSTAVATLLPATHEAAAQLMQAVGLVDLIIPRGGRKLIDFVRSHSLVPVIETGAGICHAYFHHSGDLDKGRRIVLNAKTRRVSVCNALDCLLVDRSRIGQLLELVEPLAAKNVVLHACPEAFEALDGRYPLLQHADDDCWGREWRDYAMSVRVVGGIDEALSHIARYSSRHSESIIADDAEACRRFTREVDAACVYTNLPTSFTDGGQFGFGAEIGISTQKLHARGPMGLPEITTYKYVIAGDGQTREP